MPRILMCPPDYFGIEYEINPWMNRSIPVDHTTAVRQWNSLHELLQSCGVTIELIEPQPRLADLVFTANAALIAGRTAVLSRFRHPQRQGEERRFDARLEQPGFNVMHLPEDEYFEGAGDAWFCGETLFAGYRIRSTVKSLQHVASLIGEQVVPLGLVDKRFYHLDPCFCPLASSTAIWFPDAFDQYARQVLQSAVPVLIALNETEASCFAANAVVVGKHVVTNTGCSTLLLGQLCCRKIRQERAGTKTIHRDSRGSGFQSVSSRHAERRGSPSLCQGPCCLRSRALCGWRG